jgi:hypothetical protein
MCPAIYVSSCCHMCQHTTTSAIHVSSYCYMCPHTAIYVSSCRQRQEQHACSTTSAIYVCSYRYICVLMQAATGAARRPHAALARATHTQSEREQERPTRTERARKTERASERERHIQRQRERVPPPFQSARISGTTTSATTRALRSPPPPPLPPVTPPQRHMRQRSSPQRGRLMYKCIRISSLRNV